MKSLEKLAEISKTSAKGRFAAGSLPDRAAEKINDVYSRARGALPSKARAAIPNWDRTPTGYLDDVEDLRSNPHRVALEVQKTLQAQKQEDAFANKMDGAQIPGKPAYLTMRPNGQTVLDMRALLQKRHPGADIGKMLEKTRQYNASKGYPDFMAGVDKGMDVNDSDTPSVRRVPAAVKVVTSYVDTKAKPVLTVVPDESRGTLSSLNFPIEPASASKSDSAIAAWQARTAGAPMSTSATLPRDMGFDNTPAMDIGKGDASVWRDPTMAHEAIHYLVGRQGVEDYRKASGGSSGYTRKELEDLPKDSVADARQAGYLMYPGYSEEENFPAAAAISGQMLDDTGQIPESRKQAGEYLRKWSTMSDEDFAKASKGKSPEFIRGINYIRGSGDPEVKMRYIQTFMNLMPGLFARNEGGAPMSKAARLASLSMLLAERRR